LKQAQEKVSLDELEQDISVPEDYYQENIIAFHSGKSYEEVYDNSDRDYWMKADEAKDYGLLDEVLTRAIS